MLLRTITVPTEGSITRIQSMQWTGEGQEVLVSVGHNFYYPARTDGVYDTLRTKLMRFSASTGMLTNTPFQTSRWIAGVIGNCGYWYWGNSNISNDGERRIVFNTDSTNCTFQGVHIRSTRDNSMLQMNLNSGLTSSYSWWGGWGWGGGSFWSPNDSLYVFREAPPSSNQYPTLVFVNTFTGQVKSRVVFPQSNGISWSGWWGNDSWSPDSERLLVDAAVNTASGQAIPQRYVVNIAQGTIQPTIRTMQSSYLSGWGGGLGTTGGITWGWGGWGWGGNTAPTGTSSMTWSPDGRFLAGYVWSKPTFNNSFNRHEANKVGIWNACTGCLIQTFRLPFPDDSDSPERRTFCNHPVQWSADGKRLLLFSNVKLSDYRPITNIPGASAYNRIQYDGTALIASVNVQDIPCQEDVSDTLWTILPRGAIRISDVAFPPLLCGATTNTVSFEAANFSRSRIILRLPTISGANADDFSLVSASNTSQITTTSGTESVITFGAEGGRVQFSVQFTPRGIGLRTAQMTFTDTTGFVVETMTLSGRKDTLAVSPAVSQLNLGRMLQNQTSTGSVLLRNTGTVPLMLGAQGLMQAVGDLTTPSSSSSSNQGGAQGNQQLRSIGGSFTVDSLSPRVMMPNETARLHISFFRTDNEGNTADSVELLRCGMDAQSLVVSGRIVPNEPRLEMDTLLNFGHLICQESSNATIMLYNQGGRPLRISTISFFGNSTFFPVSPASNLVIPPFDSLPFTVRYMPFQTGVARFALFINSDDPRRLRKVVNLLGQTTLYRYEWSTQTVNFGRVPFGRSATRTLELTNIGGATFVPRLPIALGPDFVWESMQPSVVQPGSTATVTMRFNGKREQGNVGANLDVSMNDRCDTKTRLEFAAVVLGAEPRIAIQDTVRLSRLFCETATQASIPFSNDGDAELRINSMAWEGRDSVHFPITSFAAQATTLRAAQTSRIDFRYAPRLQNEQFGEHSLTLLLRTNDTTRSSTGEVRVVILAQKDSVGIAPARGRVSFSTVEEMTALRDTILLRNTGSVPLLWSNLSPTQQIPFAIDSVFVVERIEPAITPPNSASRLIVRFVGNQAGFSAMRTFSLQAASPLAPECIRTTTFTLQADVLREPRLSVVQPAPVRLLCENTTTFTVRLRSIGTDEVVLQTPTFEQNPQNIFRLESAPMRMNARTGTGNVMISVNLRQSGTFTAQVRLRSNAANLPDTVITITVRKDSSGIQALLPTLEFSALPANTPAERTITIANTGTIPQGVVLPLRAGVFVLDSLGANPVQPNSQTQARVRFLGGMGGTVRDTLRLTDSCGRVLAIPLQARVVSAVATLPDTVSVQVGDVVEVPIFLRNRRSVDMGTEVAFQVKVDNISLLDIIAPTPQKMDYWSIRGREGGAIGQTMFFRANIASEQETEALVRLRIRGLLGNATTTTIILDNVRLNNVPQSSTDTAFYRSRGVNYAGGVPRLISSPNLQGFSLAPNPVDAEARLSLTLREPSAVVVEITNILGTKQIVFSGIVQQGEQIVRVPLQHCISGAYWLECRVNPASLGEERVVKRITIVR
jgi:hypothetical protein